MKRKIIAFTPLILGFLYPLFAFELIDTTIFGHDLFDYSYPVFFASIISALIGLFIIKGKMKMIPILAILVILPAAWLSMMLSMS